jgi:hypothetical protein
VREATGPPGAQHVACTAGGLTGRVGPVSLGAGQYLQYRVLTNIGSQACKLAGGPRVITGVRADGGRVTLATGAASGGLDFGLGGPANLRPGQSAEVAIKTTSPCSRALSGAVRNYVSLEIGITHSGKVRINFPGGRPYDAICGIGASNFGIPVHDHLISGGRP